ncbi:hypothetical protein Adeg_2176 (plasmid) [Ammonifex degensii KC4]|uniref:Uncharacterized protein n=1 Tax=Ammonifex degensii (strain DSM 10501 / KC4) TaxID=429009 RepID=C9RDI1_AMMDK|nr:hypothetical protein Adeg_2176 [Ammonifex degensii KC4]
MVDAKAFENMQRLKKAGLWACERKKVLERILQLRARIAERTGMQPDSTPLVRQLREESRRYE